MSLSFRQRVLLLVTGLVVVAQLASLAAVLTTIGREVQEEMRVELDRSAERLMQLFRRRSTLLLGSAEVLASDFGFRSAIASGDADTILSALENNIGRIDADMASLVSLDGRLGPSTLEAATGDGDRTTYARLAAEAEEGGIAVATVVLGRRARQVVVVPVKAPLDGRLAAARLRARRQARPRVRRPGADARLVRLPRRGGRPRGERFRT